MSKKVFVLSAISFAVALVMAGIVWVTLSVLARLNPELLIGSDGYIPELSTEEPQCSGDTVCMEYLETGETRRVASSCMDETDDVASLEASGWIRCNATSAEPVIPPKPDTQP